MDIRSRRKYKKPILCVLTALTLLVLLSNLYYEVDPPKSGANTGKVKTQSASHIESARHHVHKTISSSDIALYKSHGSEDLPSTVLKSPQAGFVQTVPIRRGNSRRFGTGKEFGESIAPSQDHVLDRVLKNVKTCLDATHMGREANETVALSNAEYFYNEYRKVIPFRFLANYSSHCWKMHFDAALFHTFMYQGHIGEYHLRDGLLTGAQTLRNPMNELRDMFKGKFSSEVVCLPKVFLAGFPKCGSTYAWCFLQSLVRLSTNLGIGARIEVDKEPHFWVRVRVTQSVKLPKVTDLGEYLLNFLPGLSKIDALKKKDVLMMDGTPNMLFDWPRFSHKQPNSSNCCLLPSVLPELLPRSKYILIMRNPVKMVYSAFWFSCTTKGISVPYKTQLMGPDLFHDRVRAKIDMFNDCMRDPSVIELKEACSIDGESGYDSCIVQRLHLLDQCVRKISFNLFSEELPECGRSRIEMGLYYSHIRKWLTVIPKERMFFLTLEQLGKEPTVVARRLLDFLGFPPSESVLSNVKRITLTCSENSQDTIDYKHDPKLKMKENTKAMLLKFFKPFNTLLADLLQDSKFLWDNH